MGSFVDDLKTTTHGINKSHVEVHMNMGDNLIMDLKGLRAKVSKTNASVGGRKRDTLALQRAYQKRGVTAAIKSAAKYLGLATTGGEKPSMVTIKDRIGTAKKSSKQGIMAKQEKLKSASPIHHRGIPASGVWYGRGGILPMGSANH